MNGVGRRAPFLTIRMTPSRCQMKMRPSGAKVTPTGLKGARVATGSEKNPASVKVMASTGGGANEDKEKQHDACQQHRGESLSCSRVHGRHLGCAFNLGMVKGLFDAGLIVCAIPIKG